MNKSYRKKSEQLGMPFGTAQGKLRKKVLFHLLKRLNESTCYRCSKEIENISNLSIEHKKHWLDSKNPKELFFDIKNIAFSHLSCNCTSKRLRKKEFIKHGTRSKYNHHNCKCPKCKKAHKEYRKSRREKGLT